MTVTENRFPRRYCFRAATKIFYVLLSAIGIAAGTIGTIYFGSGHGRGSLMAHLFMVVTCLVFLAMGAYLLVAALLLGPLILREDELELPRLVRPIRVKRSDIRGYRTYYGSSH
jgi:hypothetical protein